MQGGEDHHDGQVGCNDCVEDLCGVAEVVGRLAQHVQKDCGKVGAHDNAEEVALERNIEVKPVIFFLQSDSSNRKATNLFIARVVDEFVTW